MHKCTSTKIYEGTCGDHASSAQSCGENSRSRFSASELPARELSESCDAAGVEPSKTSSCEPKLQTEKCVCKSRTHLGSAWATRSSRYLRKSDKVMSVEFH